MLLNVSLPETYKTWLSDKANEPYRTELIELDHTGGTIGLCTQPLLRRDTGDLRYDPFLHKSPVLVESLKDHVSTGDCSAINPNPDEWRNLSFRGHEYRTFFGDVRWPRNKFQPVARGVTQYMVPDERKFDFKLVDRGFLLSKNIEQSQASIDGKQIEIPMAFGSCFNVAGELIEYAHQIFQLNSGAVDGIYPKDKGVPVPFTPDFANGKIKLRNKPENPTFDIEQADNSILKIMQAISTMAGFGEIKYYGLAGWQRLAKMGITVSGTPTWASVLDTLAESVGCWWRLDAMGNIELVSDQAAPLDLTLTDHDIIDLTPEDEGDILNEITLNYAPNGVQLSDDELEGPVSAGIINEAMKVRLVNTHTKLTKRSTANTGLFNNPAERNSQITDHYDAERLIDLLLEREGKMHRTWSGKMRSIAYGLRVGDRINLNTSDVSGVALITQMTRGSGDLLSSVEFRV